MLHDGCGSESLTDVFYATYTRAKMSEFNLSFDSIIKKDPTTTLVPLRKIRPEYDPCVTWSSAPAAGFPTRDLTPLWSQIMCEVTMGGED